MTANATCHKSPVKSRFFFRLDQNLPSDRKVSKPSVKAFQHPKREENKRTLLSPSSGVKDFLRLAIRGALIIGTFKLCWLSYLFFLIHGCSHVCATIPPPPLFPFTATPNKKHIFSSTSPSSSEDAESHFFSATGRWASGSHRVDRTLLIRPHILLAFGTWRVVDLRLCTPAL